MRLSAGILILLLLSGCRAQKEAPEAAAAPEPIKVLDEAGAKAQIQQALRGERYWVSVRPLLPLIANQNFDYTQTTYGAGPGVVVYKLVSAGYLLQDTASATYPVISGRFRGKNTCVRGAAPTESEQLLDFVLTNQSERCFPFTLTLELQSMAGSTEVAGTADTCIERSPCPRPLETGTLGADGSFTFSSVGPQQSDGRFFYVERDRTAYLVRAGGDWLYTGSPTGERTEVKTYLRHFATNVTLRDNAVAAGVLDVDDVSNLFLSLETRATADFVWRAAPDALGKILLGESVPTGQGKAEFAKKPDGTWALIGPLRFSAEGDILNFQGEEPPGGPEDEPSDAH